MASGSAGPFSSLCKQNCGAIAYATAEIDQERVVTERVQDGVTGEVMELTYRECKVVGSGSFGVVFQTKLGVEEQDAAIKRVLQDKRFKV